MPRSTLVTGATGYVGGELVPVLLEHGHQVRALARTPQNAKVPAGVDVAKGDVVSGDGLAARYSGAAETWMAVSPTTRASVSRTSAGVVPGTMRQFTLAVADCGSALFA